MFLIINNFKEHPQIIIISSKEKYALEAFEYDVTDYILKPVSYARFFKAIKKEESKNETNATISKGNDKDVTSGSNEIFIN